MKRWWLFVVLIAGLFAAGCKSETQVTKVETPAPKAETPVPVSQPPAVPLPEGAQLVKLTIKVPPEAISPRGGGGRGGRRDCPQSRLQELFGVRFAQPHGCIVGEVESNSAAEQIGLKAGDSIIECNGDKVTCPASLLQRLPLGKEPGLIELTIARNTGERAP